MSTLVPHSVHVFTIGRTDMSSLSPPLIISSFSEQDDKRIAETDITAKYLKKFVFILVFDSVMSKKGLGNYCSVATDFMIKFFIAVSLGLTLR